MHQVVQSLITAVPRVRIAVIGDVMLDENIEGPTSRIAPEAPVPIILKENERALPGGAANVAAAVAALGSTCTLIGLVGADDAAGKLKNALKKDPRFVDGLIVDPSRPTTVKTRFWGTGHGPKQLLARIDTESTNFCEGKVKQTIIDAIRNLNDQDLIVIADYSKGVVHDDIIHAAITTGIPVVLAPKPTRQHMNIEAIRGVKSIVCNFKEACMAANHAGCTASDINEVAAFLHKYCASDLIITRGKDGIYALTQKGECYQDVTKAREVYDVTGAGDIVLAGYSVGIAAGLQTKEAVHMANLAAGIKVSKVGVATVSLEELRLALH